MLSFSACCEALFSKSGLIGVGLCLLLLGLLIVMVMRMGYSDVGEYDAERNLTYSNKGTYGTAGFMEKAEMKGVLDLVPDIRKHSGVILGKLDNQVVCIPENSRLNGNIAVFGASGSMKTRAYCINRILQSASETHNGHKESLIITDPKSELYEKTSEYLRSKGYVVKVFNLIQPENSDSWNCLAEIEGDELMAQIFCDIIIRNTGSEKGDHFWNAAEMNLLKALVLYVALGYPPESRNIGEVYKLLVLNAEKELDNRFSMLPASHPARAPYALFSQSSDTVRSGVIIGLGSRLQVFQNRPICQITSHDEIDMELPGKQPCAYFCITSDQDSTFDFLTSLFLSFAFIKLIRYADKNCADRRLPVPVHVLGEELTACGVIPDLSRKISVIRSRGVSMSCVFQNLAGLQNRYPYNQWQEMRITYAATLTADAKMGDTDNPNEVVLTWRRTNNSYFDTLKDCCHVYTYGIDVLKRFSDNGGNLRNVKFRLHNDTDDCYIIADLKDGIYYAKGITSKKSDATTFIPNSSGHIVVKGLEDDAYSLTEIATDKGYVLLKDAVKIVIKTAESGQCEKCGAKLLTASATVNGKDVTMSEGNAIVPLTVVNNPGFDLPKTGGYGTWMFTVGGVALLGAAAFIVIRSRKHKGER